jgi:hypothetical protein
MHHDLAKLDSTSKQKNGVDEYGQDARDIDLKSGYFQRRRHVRRIVRSMGKCGG